MSPAECYLVATPLVAEGNTFLWIGVFLAGAAVVALVFKRQSRRSALLDPPRRKGAADEELRQSMDRLLVGLQETSREINATIDTKTVVLNKLIEEADRRIEALKALEKGAAAGLGQAPARVGPPPKEIPPTEESRRRAALERDILRMADAGKTDLEIARLTGVARGEVELVLSLRRAPGAEGKPNA
jgi:hypothetical protein